MRFSAGPERADERLAEELEFRLHLDSLPIPQSIRLNEYSIPSDGIRWDVFDKNITKLLGEEAYLWNTYSRPEDGWYTMYATRPLTVSQINDLKVWSAYASEEDRMAAEDARRRGEKDGDYRTRERELIRLEREEREARDQERWRREKRRREFEREVAWEERKRDEWRRYLRQRAVAEEEARRADRIEERIRRMEVAEISDETAASMEDDDDIPDESEWRKTVLRRRFGASKRWELSNQFREAASVNKPGKRILSTRSIKSHSSRYLIRDDWSNMEWEVITRISARVHDALES